MNPNPLKTKLENALRIDRAFRFVWQAGPGWTVASAVLVVFQGALPLFSLYLLKLIIDSVSEAVTRSASSIGPATGDGFSTVAWYIALAGGVGLLTAICGFFSEYAKKAQSLAVADHMFSVLHEKSTSVDLAYYESPQYRDTLHRAQREGPYRPTSIVNGLILAGRSGASLVAVLWLLVLFNPFLCLVLVAAALPGVLMRFQYSDKIYAWQKQRTEDERRAFYYNWMLTGDAHARELRLFGLGDHFRKRFKAIRSVLRNEKLSFEKKRALGDLVGQSSTTLAVFGSFIYIASRTVQGTISLGDMVMYFQAFQKGLQYLRSFLESVAGLYEDNLFLLNFYEFLDVKPRINESDTSNRVLETIQSGFEMSDVTFRYQQCEKNVLDCVNFYIAPGEIVALVGENGSGKSTLVKLLCRLYDPDSGSVRLDGINIKRFGVKNYRKRISVVFQDYIRYNMTARENIRLGDINNAPDEDRIEAAAQKAGIKDYIESLHSGLDTPLGRMFKNGAELSVGQWQMTALARAFFRDADLVILDEPASSLDVKSEYEVFNRFKELVKDKAALIISHRFSTVRMADRICLLKDGKIAEEGSHDALMEMDKEYAALFRKQAGQYL
ncbi:MAG: ABC transporter ATP-binding protein [Desulfobacteraceae bacterium]|nr:ABC transporter ATP-binding protein [Desulfobacteraceae bacterium]